MWRETAVYVRITQAQPGVCVCAGGRVVTALLPGGR